jgi:hypothetical protein
MSTGVVTEIGASSAKALVDNGSAEYVQ